MPPNTIFFAVDLFRKLILSSFGNTTLEILNFVFSAELMNRFLSDQGYEMMIVFIKDSEGGTGSYKKNRLLNDHREADKWALSLLDSFLEMFLVVFNNATKSALEEVAD